MNDIKSLNFNNTYRKLPSEFYHIVKPAPFKSPYLIAINPDAASLIDLDTDEDPGKLSEYLSGKEIIPGSEPLAMYYTGHQFGVYNKDIGDGRAILLGEVENKEGGKWDLHLKGAGRTRFSRQFDGRAVLRSVIREYLCSEAIHGLGIPTTRALCIIGSGEMVQREKKEPAAMMIRLARTHVRFGSFEGFYYSGDYENVKRLADYVIEQNYPKLADSDKKYDLLLVDIARRTASLIAKWQSVGFTHGVMNTDNMSVIGDTLDYGPFGFMDDFMFDYIPNHSDHFGRYSYRSQPQVGLWNLKKLSSCLGVLTTNGILSEALEEYKSTYMTGYLERMASKLGFTTFRENDKKFIEDTLNMLEDEELDYTIFFRKLSDLKKKSKEMPEYSSVHGEDIYEWIQNYRERLCQESVSDEERRESMDSVNPVYILRNYLAENAIRKAEDEGDYSEIENLRILLSEPFNEKEGMESYAQEPPEWGKGLVLSCSS